MSPQQPFKQRGLALISVMLVLALCAIWASQITAHLSNQVNKSVNIELNQQAYWYAMGAESLAKMVLKESFKTDRDSTNLSQLWAQEEQTYPVEQGTITGKIRDLRSCLNLNALRAPPPANADTSNNKKRPYNRHIKIYW